ncbi:hypothetical protein BGZ63DRAFT_506834 [Mariannaea sp. PMI_226]|nr:hypothetical protein BGZ63DRAFT_506834 [Mariannaea sp. PMI_226]
MRFVIALYSIFLCFAPTLGAFTVGVNFNILYDQSNGQGGFADSVIQQQLLVLNSFYNRIGLFFRLAQAPRRILVPGSYLSSWGNPNVKVDLNRQFGVQNPQILNIYTAGPIPNEAYDSSFPHEYASNPARDGIIINYQYMPGGPAVGYNTGKMLATAVGHWLGLYDTWAGGCSGPGDFVDDTPAQASQPQGCPTGRDTCPQPGLDPIQNLMGGGADECRVQLTNGQYNRIAQQIAQYRGIRLFN